MPREAPHRVRPAPVGAPRVHAAPAQGGIDRPFYELCALSELRDRLRAGDVWVAGSRQYQAFDDYLLPDAAWQDLRRAGSLPVAVEADAAAYLERRRREVHDELTAVDRGCSRPTGCRTCGSSGDRLVITPLVTAVPPEAEALVQRTAAALPLVKITDLLVEVDELTGFTRHFTHLQTGRPPKDRTALYTVLLAEATNLGLEKMAQACPGAAYDALAWAADWHLRDETYTRALAELINTHHRHPFAAHWGEGTTSSSDAQRFPAGGRRESIGQVNARYGREPGVKFYAHLSDQYGPYYPTVISATACGGALRPGRAALPRDRAADRGALHRHRGVHRPGLRALPPAGLPLRPAHPRPGRQAALPLREAGRLPGAPAPDRRAGPAAAHRGALGRAPPAGRLDPPGDGRPPRSSCASSAAYPRQNGLAVALREVGRVERTLFTLDWLQSPDLRRRVTRRPQQGGGRPGPQAGGGLLPARRHPRPRRRGPALPGQRPQPGGGGDRAVEHGLPRPRGGGACAPRGCRSPMSTWRTCRRWGGPTSR